MASTISSVTSFLDDIYPRHWAQDWDRVGLVAGRGQWPVRKALCVVDCVPETLREAIEIGADLIVAHHPLLLRGVSHLDPATSYKGDIVHSLIENQIGLYVAHTNADVANPGVSDALADRIGLQQLSALAPLPEAEHLGSGRGIGRVGNVPEAMTMREFVTVIAQVLPQTAWGVRATGQPDQIIRTVAVSGGAGDSYLSAAQAVQADVFVTSDLRHHPVSEFLAGAGIAESDHSIPALIDVAHYASERPWADLVARQLTAVVDEVAVSDIVTDPWTLHRLP